MPSRQLWVLARNGHCLSNPAMLLCEGEIWTPLCDLLALDWIYRGCGEVDEKYRPRPFAVVTALTRSGGEDPHL